MAINTRAFVEPAVAEAGVHAHDHAVLAAIIQEVSQVEAERRVPIVVAAYEEAVQEHECAAERAIEFQDDAPARVFPGNVEYAPVPANTVLRIAATQRFVAVPLQLVIIDERQLDGPVVRQIQRPPFRVVKFLQSKFELTRLGEVSLTHAKPQVAPGIASVSRQELPSEIEEETLSRSERFRGVHRRCATIGRQQRMNSTGWTCKQR